MDCGNFCISWILSNINQKYEDLDFIFSEKFPEVSLLPKIGISLLKHFLDIEIIHENEKIFINLNKEEIPLLEEYKYRLNEFQKLGGNYSNHKINIEYLKDNLRDNYCLIPIKNGEGSHFVILDSINEYSVNLVDNKKGNFSVAIGEFENMIDLYNGKYLLFVKK